jgi:hypothetical protein
MTRDRRSHCMIPNCPPDRNGSGCASIASGVPEQEPNGQIPIMIVVQMPRCRDELLQAAAFLACSTDGNAPIPHRQKIRRHSMPIARAAGGAV